VTTIVTVNHEHRITNHAFKNSSILKYGWIHLGLNVEESIPPMLRAPRMLVGRRVTNLLFRIQNAEKNVSSLIEATGFFTQEGLNQRGIEFAENVLPYFVYALNTIEPTFVNDEDTWSAFVEEFITRISGGEMSWTTVG